MLGYRGQLQDPELSRRWTFPAFEVAISEIWDSACVTMLRDMNAEGQDLCTELQERVVAWATRTGTVDLTPASLFEKYIASVPPEKALLDLTCYLGLRALGHLWRAKALQRGAQGPNVDAAICLIRGMSAAHLGDHPLRATVHETLGWEQGAEMQIDLAKSEQHQQLSRAAKAAHARHARDRVTVYKRFQLRRNSYSSYNEAAEDLRQTFEYNYTVRTIAGWLSAADKANKVQWTPSRRRRRRDSD